VRHRPEDDAVSRLGGRDRRHPDTSCLVPQRRKADGNAVVKPSLSSKRRSAARSTLSVAAQISGPMPSPSMTSKWITIHPLRSKPALVLSAILVDTVYVAQREMPQRPLPRLRGRDREGAYTREPSRNPLPNPSPAAGEEQPSPPDQKCLSFAQAFLIPSHLWSCMSLLLARVLEWACVRWFVTGEVDPQRFSQRRA